MTLEEFFKGYDVLVTSVTGAYILGTVYIWRKSADMGNLKLAQDTAIKGIAVNYDGAELVDVISRIQEQDARLLMPPTKNKLFFFVSLLTIVLGAVAVFHASFSKIYPQFISYIYADVGLFILVLLFGFFVMAREYRYLTTINNFRPDGNKKKIQIKVN